MLTSQVLPASIAFCFYKGLSLLIDVEGRKCQGPPVPWKLMGRVLLPVVAVVSCPMLQRLVINRVQKGV